MGGNPPPSPPSSCWFSYNNSEMVKAVTLEFYSIQEHFIKNIRGKFSFPNSFQSPDIGKNSDRDISTLFPWSIHLIKENCYISRTSNDFGMKFGKITKLVKRNTATSKKLTIASCWKTVTSLSFF